MSAAEAEVKVALSPEEYRALPECMAQLGFRRGEATEITDHYVAYGASPLGGWDFTRVRRRGTRWTLTEKRWGCDPHGQQVRLEEERELSADEARALLVAGGPVLQKLRQEFLGRVDQWPTSVVLDAVSLDGAVRYFLECEVMTTAEHAAEMRATIARWMQAHLPVSDLSEAPSMLELALTHDRKPTTEGES